MIKSNLLQKIKFTLVLIFSLTGMKPLLFNLIPAFSKFKNFVLGVLPTETKTLSNESWKIISFF